MTIFTNSSLKRINPFQRAMSSLLKDLYSPSFFDRFSEILSTLIPSFNRQLFVEEIFTEGFKQMELKERMRHTTLVLHQFLPADYTKATKVIETLIIKLRAEQFGEYSLVFMFLPDYIETYGLDHYDDSVKALELVTQFISCEFAVRPFILKYGQRMIDQMVKWSLHESHHVRRLASEGSRPRLPWAMALPALKKDPSAILPILENLKNDPGEWVRRSVANNLNDIAKDNPEIVLDIAAKWKGFSKETDAVIKHGCRTLLKQGHLEILKFYNLDSSNLAVADFKVLTPEVGLGDYLSFSFGVINNHTAPLTVRLEYAIYYRKQNGQLSRKVFKISERICQPAEIITVIRRQSFKMITTRKFYEGEHKIAIVVNGVEQQPEPFVLQL